MNSILKRMYRLAKSEINDYIDKTASNNPELDQIERDLDAEIGERERQREEKRRREQAQQQAEARRDAEEQSAREREEQARKQAETRKQAESRESSESQRGTEGGADPQAQQSWTDRVNARIKREREVWKQRYEAAQRKFEEATRRVEEEERRYREWKESQRRQRARDSSGSSSGYSGYRSSYGTPRGADEALLKHYKNLGVAPGATKDEIKSAWRKLMRQYHPDKHATDKEKYEAATALTQELTLSYRTIIKHLDGR